MITNEIFEEGTLQVDQCQEQAIHTLHHTHRFRSMDITEDTEGTF